MYDLTGDFCTGESGGEMDFASDGGFETVRAKRCEPKERSAPLLAKLLFVPRKSPLHREAECDVNTRIHRVA